MRSSASTLQNHYLKNDVSFMEDEPEEPEPKQQQEIIQKINKLYLKKKKQLKKKLNQLK